MGSVSPEFDWSLSGGGDPRKGGSAAVNENSILERVTAAAEERQLSPNTLISYRRTCCPRLTHRAYDKDFRQEADAPCCARRLAMRAFADREVAIIRADRMGVPLSLAVAKSPLTPNKSFPNEHKKGLAIANPCRGI
jgi:hypothetical protein